MKMSNLRLTLMVALLGASSLFAACGKKESPAEQAIENVKDGLNVRDNEKLKDAGEDMKSGMENAGEAVKDKAEEVKEDVKN